MRQKGCHLQPSPAMKKCHIHSGWVSAMARHRARQPASPSRPSLALRAAPAAPTLAQLTAMLQDWEAQIELNLRMTHE